MLEQGSYVVWKKIFGLLVWKKKMIFRTCSFDMCYHNIYSRLLILLFIVLPIIVPVFDLDMSFRKDSSRENDWK